MKTAYGDLQRSIVRRIKHKGADWAFTPSDLADLGDPRSVGKALTRLVQTGSIRRVRRGLYEIPRQHPMIGTVGASADAVVAAFARRDGLSRVRRVTATRRGGITPFEALMVPPHPRPSSGPQSRTQKSSSSGAESGAYDR